MLNNNYLSQKEQNKILARWKKNPNEKDRNIILENNFRLIAKLANDLCQKIGSRELFNDLFQEGVVGAIMSIKTYDPEKGSFSNWLPWWSRNLMLKWLDAESFCVRVPNHVICQIRQMKKSISSYEEENGKIPSNDWVKESFSIKDKKMGDLNFFLTSEVKLNAHPEEYKDCLFKNENINNEYKTFDCVADDSSPIPNEEVGRQDEYLFLREALGSKLSDLERLVLEHRSGLLDGEPKTCREIGEIFGVSKQRVNQIETKATDKLKKYYSFLDKGYERKKRKKI